MDIFGQAPTQSTLFFILYGITGVVPLIAALYLLLRRGNAFAPDVTPPMRLRRWAASFFAVSVLSHVWWYLFYIYSCKIFSVVYFVVVLLDCVALLTTIAGTLLSMLQDRRRPVWPALVAMIPFVALCGVLMVSPSNQLKQIALAYVLLLFVLFTIYMMFAVRRYGRWLYDNYADLENKRVWLIQIVTLGCLLLLFLYAVVDIRSVLVYFIHVIELLLFGLLLWRVETLPLLENSSVEQDSLEPAEATQEQELPAQERPAPAIPANLIQQVLDERCVATQLYLQHDLTLQQLATAVGINRFYLSQFFSSHGTTYNAYINDLRINHFVCLYREAVANGHSLTAQQLAYDSGYHSYSTFSLAFKQRMGQSVTAWIRETAD